MKKRISIFVMVLFLLNLPSLIAQENAAPVSAAVQAPTVSFDEFSTGLKSALVMLPGSVKLDKYKQLRKQAVELGQEKLFFENLQEWVAIRKAVELQQLSEFLNFTAYNPAFATFRTQLIDLAGKARQPITYADRIKRLDKKIEKATVSETKKKAFLAEKDIVMKKMNNFFQERGGKTQAEISSLQEFFNNAKSSALFTDPKDVRMIDIWIKSASTSPTPFEQASYLWQKLKSGWAAKNRDIFFKSLTSLKNSIDKAHRAKTLKMGPDLINKLLNAIRYSDAFTSEQQKLATAWLQELDNIIQPKVSDEKLTYDQRLDKVIDMLLNPNTFIESSSRKYLFRYLQDVINNKIYAKPGGLKKLESIPLFVQWNDQLTPKEKAKVALLITESKAVVSYPDQVKTLIQYLSKVAADPSKKGKLLERVEALVNRFVSEIVAGKKPLGQAEITNLLNIIKINPLFMNDNKIVEKINKMVASITGAKPGKTAEQIKKEKAEQVKKAIEKKKKKVQEVPKFRGGGRRR